MENLPTCTKVLSIDVEDWYGGTSEVFKDAGIAHESRPEPSVVSNTIKCLELLARTNNRATFFVLGTVCEHYPDLVKEIVHQGYEVGTHGYYHRLIYRLTPQEFERDVKRSLDVLSRFAPDVKGYRAPYWSITRNSLWAIDILVRCGLRYDSSIFPVRRGLYGIPNAPTAPYEIRPDFWEFPPATIPVFGQNIPIVGGGYLRIIPYRLIAHAMRQVDRETRKPNILVFYYHPYDLDPSDMRMKHRIRLVSSYLYSLQQKLGRGSMPGKILRLLENHRFVSFDDLMNDNCEDLSLENLSDAFFVPV